MCIRDSDFAHLGGGAMERDAEPDFFGMLDGDEEEIVRREDERTEERCGEGDVRPPRSLRRHDDSRRTRRNAAPYRASFAGPMPGTARRPASSSGRIAAILARTASLK